MAYTEFTLKGGTVYRYKSWWRAFARYSVLTGEYDDAGRPMTATKELSKVFKVKGKRVAKQRADAWIASLNENAEKGARPAETVSEYLDAFIASKNGRVEKSTIAGYERRAGYVKKGLGDVRITDLTPDMVASWMNEMRKSYTPQTVNDARTLLKSAMEDAYINQRIPFNPVSRVQKLKQAKKEPNALDARNRAKLIEDLFSDKRIANESQPAKLGIKLALFTGMREGEICGLRWRNVDLINNTIKVRESIGRDGEGSYVKEPKTGGSRRDIPMPRVIAKELAARRADMRAKCIEAGVPFRTDFFVLGDIDGSHMQPRLLWRAWTRRASRLKLIGTQGLVPTFHDLRHTYATAAISGGVDVKSVSSILGHANVAMTLNIYTSADKEATRRAMDKVESEMLRQHEEAKVLEFKPTGTEG